MVKNAIKNKARKVIYNNKLFFRIYIDYLYKPKNELDRYLDKLSKTHRGNFFFVQIGANDGMINDPFYKFIKRNKWQGLLIEPQKRVFEELKNNYSNFNGMIFENIAITEKPEVKKLYKISFSNSRRATGISSFLKEDLQKFIEAGYAKKIAQEENLILPRDKEDWITTENVKCLSLNSVLVKHNITKIDLLIIDVEGYDYEIIKSIPFHTIKPQVIIYEHSHFNGYIKTECSNFLLNAGYKLKVTKTDTIAELK